MIKIHCYNCNQYYKIRSSSNKDEMELNIRYAKCSYCGQPRDATQLQPDKIVDKNFVRVPGVCDECGSEVSNKKYNLCRNCYSRSWKQATGFNTIYMKKWRKNHYKR